LSQRPREGRQDVHNIIRDSYAQECIDQCKLTGQEFAEDDKTSKASYDSLTQECIDECKLAGQEFAEDDKYVHNIIQSLDVGEDAERWVKDHKRSKIRRIDILTLVVQFAAEENHLVELFVDAESLEKSRRLIITKTNGRWSTRPSWLRRRVCLTS
jgi:hypothetical protein